MEGFAGGVFCFGGEPPGFSGGGAVEADEGGERAELGPAGVEDGVGGAVESSGVVAPEGDAAESVAESAAQGGGHGGEGALAVAAPLGGVALPAEVGGAGPDQVVSLDVAGDLGDGVVEQQGVDVVQVGAGHAVGGDGVGGDAFPEVGFEDGDALQEGAVGWCTTRWSGW